ncbi:MAG: hypothetical protein V4685_10745 [Bacteroidota bacterium]
MSKFITTIYLIAFTCGFISCAKESNDTAAANESGKGGSLAKFTIAGNYLYTVDENYLDAYDITNATAPVKTSSTFVGIFVETIYPYKNRLFIGSRAGMFIYSIDTPSVPSLMGAASHVRSCDPVVANDSIAFVTLKGGSACGPATSGLYIHDVKDLFNPVFKKLVEIENPEGLGIQDSTLYICNNAAGLKVYNITNPENPVEKRTINDGNYYKDVIPDGNLLICYVLAGILLYDISDPENPVRIKLITN